jgi:hypothetical protein
MIKDSSHQSNPDWKNDIITCHGNCEGGYNRNPRHECKRYSGASPDIDNKCIHDRS